MGDPVGDPLGGFADRSAVEMRIARGRFGPAVTEQPPDDRQTLAEGERPRGEAVANFAASEEAEWAICPAKHVNEKAILT